MLLYFFLLLNNNTYIIYPDQNEAESHLNIAKKFIENNYKLIKEIENYDVNISGYVFEINKAINYYENSKIEYLKTNYTGSIIMSDKSITISKKINEVLSEIRIMMLEKNDFSVTINTSTRVLLSIIIGLFFYYFSRLLKQKYNDDLLKMKPKVNLNGY